jgi:hypothetical protein
VVDSHWRQLPPPTDDKQQLQRDGEAEEGHGDDADTGTEPCNEEAEVVDNAPVLELLWGSQPKEMLLLHFSRGSIQAIYSRD